MRGAEVVTQSVYGVQANPDSSDCLEAFEATLLGPSYGMINMSPTLQRLLHSID